MTDEPFDENAVEEAWDRTAALWTDSLRAGHDLFRELYVMPAFQEFMPEIADRAVIDLGCGEGTNTRRFARLGGKVTGIDISGAMLDRAREAERQEPLGIRYERCSFADIGFAADDSFDVALSTLALMDGPDFPAAVSEARRVLVPGGALCFSVLHPCFFTRVFDWIRDQDGQYLGVRAGRYFDRSPFVERWRFGKHPDARDLPFFEIPRFPRTLSDYVNAVCTAGLRITKIEEPRPTAEASEDREWLARFRDHAPLVLFVEARKA